MFFRSTAASGDDRSLFIPKPQHGLDLVHRQTPVPLGRVKALLHFCRKLFPCLCLQPSDERIRELTDKLEKGIAQVKERTICRGARTGHLFIAQAVLHTGPYFLIWSIYPAVMMPAGRATIAMPTKDDTIVTILPAVDTG